MEARSSIVCGFALSAMFVIMLCWVCCGVCVLLCNICVCYFVMYMCGIGYVHVYGIG